jgi:hypothetical protein
MSLEKYEARIIRGHIMQILKIAYPGPASLELLEVTLNDRSCPTSPAVIRGYVDYLADKGYVKVWEEKDDVLGVTRTLVKLTAAGVDLLEHNIPADPGVVL